MQDTAFALAAELAPDRLDELTRDLMRDLDQIGMQARPVEAPTGLGERGIMSQVGRFVIETLLSGKTANALLDVLTRRSRNQ